MLDDRTLWFQFVQVGTYNVFVQFALQSANNCQKPLALKDCIDTVSGVDLDHPEKIYWKLKPQFVVCGGDVRIDPDNTTTSHRTIYIVEADTSSSNKNTFRRRWR